MTQSRLLQSYRLPAQLVKPGFLVLLLLFLFSCKNETPQFAGICISFDDRSVTDWYSTKELLKEHDAKVTFFVTQFDSLTSSEVNMLKELEKEGHEIGSHGALHVSSRNYIIRNSYKNYLKNEIDASILSMKKSGFDPKSFAYPFGTRFLFTDFLLLKRFKVLRGVAGFKNKEDIALKDEIYYDFKGDRTLFALNIDKDSGLNAEMIQKAVKRAKDKKEVLLLFGHSPAGIPLLRFVLAEAKRNDLKFFRISELAN